MHAASQSNLEKYGIDSHNVIIKMYLLCFRKRINVNGLIYECDTYFPVVSRAMINDIVLPQKGKQCQDV